MKQQDLGQLEILGRQIVGGKRAKEFLEIYQKARLKFEYGYLCIDIGPRTTDSVNLRIHIV